MIKVIFPHAFNLGGIPIARMVDVHRQGVDSDWMQKRAAVLTKEMSAIRPEKDHSFIHLVTMGAQEFYGANRNGDGFNEKSARWEAFDPKPGGPKSLMLDGGLTQYHPTFVKYANVYKDHVNKDPKNRSGTVNSEAYNDEMHRGELIIKVSNNKFASELDRLANGEDIPFSMSCKVPYDICTACLNKAANRREYCDHLKNEMSHVKEGGHQVFAINDRPMFFDISSVFRPADRIAYGLQKVAATGEMPEEFIPSAQIAEMWGISAPTSVLLDSSPRPVQEKLAALERAAAMEKQIEATGRAFSPQVDAGCPHGNVPNETSDLMRSCDWNSLIGALSQAKICLPVKDFFRLILGNKYDSVAGEMDGVQSLLPGIFSRMKDSGDGVEDVTGMKTYDPGTSLVPKSARDGIADLMPSMSVGEDPVKRRMQITIIRGGDAPEELRKVSADCRTSKTAQYMVRQYAAYQLSFLRATEGVGDDLTTGLTVLGNYSA
jgi:hypothetical protein